MPPSSVRSEVQPLISIAEEISVPSPSERVWQVVSDPSDVVSCIRGAEVGQAHDDGSFDGSLVVRFGGIRVRFAARVTLELDESERSGRLMARGRDGQGATRFASTADFQVIDEPATGGSRVTLRGEVTLSGKLAPLIESGAGAVVARMAKDFAAELVQRCAEPTAARSEHQQTDAPPAPPGLLRRLKAWLSRLLHRRSTAPQPADPRPAQHVQRAQSAPSHAPSEEAAHDSTTAQ
ncbi:SRPBCC family protein [Streptomyces sp. NPDC019531]|uniref:SRPBCC family protein n=1 Tax=Streptomyces sp. NPDC019531 TaxID=3365062 RepID=UPI00384F51FB